MNKNNTVVVPCALALLFALIPDKVLSLGAPINNKSTEPTSASKVELVPKS